MKLWRLIPAILAAAAILPACNKDDYKKIEENPDDSVKITYLGKGFGKTGYGDIFQIETADDFRYDYTVVDKNQISSLSTYVNFRLDNLTNYLIMQNISFDEYFSKGTGSYILQDPGYGSGRFGQVYRSVLYKKFLRIRLHLLQC